MSTNQSQVAIKKLNDNPHRVLLMWQKLGNSAAGRKVFNFLLGRTVPYSGNIKAEVLSLGNGEVTIMMKDRRAIRNHLKSIHAIALANLGELASGMAMFSKISNATRAIVVDLEIKYIKKARGTLTAYGRANPPDPIDTSTTSIVEADIIDSYGDTVASIKVHWLLSPPVSEVGN